MQAFYAKNEEASRFERLWSFQIHSNLVWKLFPSFLIKNQSQCFFQQSTSNLQWDGITTTSFKPSEDFDITKLKPYIVQGSKSCPSNKILQKNKTQCNVNYAKYLLDQSFLCPGLVCKRVSTMGVNTRGQSTAIFLCITPFSVRWLTTIQPNNRVIQEQACSWPVRR